MSRRKQSNPKSFLKNESALLGGIDVESESDSPMNAREVVETVMDTDEKTVPQVFINGIEPNNETDLGSENRSSSRGSGSSSPIGIEEDTEDGNRRSVYRCGFCPEKFLEPGLLKTHEQFHSDMMPYKCRHCSKGFKHKRSQDRHEQLHTGYKKHKCSYCDAAFFRSDHLKLHLKTHETNINGKPTQSFGQSSIYLNELRTPTDFGRNGTPTHCSLCSQKFSSADQLLNHMDTEHGIMDSSSGQISTGNTPASTPKTFTAGFICPHCSRQDFISEEALDLHIEAVHGPNGSADEQRLICGLCQQIFATIEELQKHTLQRHTVQDLPLNGKRQLNSFNYTGRSYRYGDPRYGCQFCDKSFDGILGLHQHVSSVHPGAEEEEQRASSTGQSNSYLCGQCNTALPDLSTFTAHMRQHLSSGTQEGMVRPVRPTCDICGIECKDAAHLDVHLMEHYLYRESQYSCSTCTKIFGQPDELQKHLLDVHAVHVFKCSLCKELFESRVDIQVHFAVVHSKEMIQWRCRSCNSAFGTEDQFRVHVEVVHLQRPLSAGAKLLTGSHGSSSNSLICHYCNMQCSSQRELKEHVLTHSPFTCPLCCQAFSVEYLFEKHMETVHAGCYYSAPVKSTSGTTSRQSRGLTSLKQKQGKCCLITIESELSENGINGLFFPLLLQSSNSMKCNICDQKAESLEELAEHKLTHCKVNKAENCYVCFKKLDSVEEFCEHTKQHNTVQGLPVSCIVCRQTLLSQIELQSHAKHHLTLNKTENGEKNTEETVDLDKIKSEPESTEVEGGILKCDECNVKFETNEELKNHQAKSHSKPFQCIKCQKSFGTEAEIQSHVTSHVLQDGVEHFCLLCEKVFDSPAKLQAHLIEHSFAGCSEFQCYLCGLVFSMPQPLGQHMLTHGAEERPYDCPFCDQRFFFRSELDNHVLSHQRTMQPPPLKRATENPDSMKLRPNYSSKQNSSKDKQSNSASNPGSFPCPHCPKVFGSLSALQGHSHVHMANRIHQCNRCDRSFPTATKLRNHQRQHSGDKPYSCEICSRHFSRKDNLKVHMRTHYKDGYSGSCSGDELPTMVSLSSSSLNENDWSNGSD